MKAILVDDEADGIKTLQRMLGMHYGDVQVVATCSNAADAESADRAPETRYCLHRYPDAGKSGIDLIRELEERHFEIIFVTAHNEYMLQALQYSAADYLLKPVDEDRLVEINTAGKNACTG